MAVTVRKGMLLTPTVVNDALGDHIVVSCGSVTGPNYLSQRKYKQSVLLLMVNGSLHLELKLWLAVRRGNGAPSWETIVCS